MNKFNEYGNEKHTSETVKRYVSRDTSASLNNEAAFTDKNALTAKKTRDRALREQIKKELRAEVLEELREEIEVEARSKIERGLREKVEAELREEFERKQREYEESLHLRLKLELLEKWEARVSAELDRIGRERQEASEKISMRECPENLDDFEIEDDEIIDYLGDGGDVVIPQGITRIGESAFSGCDGLTSITIPPSVESIGENAFEDCENIQGVYISDLEAWCGISFGNAITFANPLYYAHKLYLNGRLVTDLFIPAGVTSIDELTFDGCDCFSSITVDKNNKVYQSRGNCLIETARKTLVAGCKNSVIPSDGSVTSIGNCAFEGRNKLTSITIPSSVTYIGDWAFNGCNLTDIIFKGTISQWDDVEVGEFWDGADKNHYKVQCTDGDVQ